MVLVCTHRGARGDPRCWDVRAVVHGEVLVAGVHMQGCMGRSLMPVQGCVRMHKEISRGSLHVRGCVGRLVVGSAHTRGCTGRSLVLIARAGVHGEISSATAHLHPCTGRSQVLGSTCRGACSVLCVQGCTETSVHTASDAQGRCRAAPSPCLHRTGCSAFLGSLPARCLHACTGLHAWSFPCKIARLRSFCLEEGASISDLFLQGKQQVGNSEMCTCVVGTLLPNSAGMEAQNFLGHVAAALVRHCKG